MVDWSSSCDSEWPYEVTETWRAMGAWGARPHVAIANGRMRSLKLAVRWPVGQGDVGCDSEWPHEVTETLF